MNVILYSSINYGECATLVELCNVTWFKKMLFCSYKINISPNKVILVIVNVRER